MALPEADAAATALGRAVTPMLAKRPGKTGIHPLLDAQEAFAARMLLAGAAERTLDAQYYIWHGDMTGTLLFEALHAAADRGVRVRLLLDDNNTSGLDDTLAALDSHGNIEIRLFNPFRIRKPRLLGYLTDFPRMNRRMHNKSFTADNRVTIIGGRNVGDEYFGVSEGMFFADLDIMAVGPVVGQVSDNFDRYWASASAVPAGRVLAPADPRRLEKLASTASLIERHPAAAAYMNALHGSGSVEDLLQRNPDLEWAETRMVSDDPGKGLGRARPEKFLSHQLTRIIGEPVASVDLVSPYFVLRAAVARAFAAWAARGVKIRVLTNSLEATDVALVHAGYAKKRKKLLEAGLTFYEMQRLSPFFVKTRRPGRMGRSGASLHAKTFSVDRSRVFIGSFNFDPRSALLNTELGFIIESPSLARRIDDVFNDVVPGNAYEVRLSDAGKLYWLERRSGGEVRHDTEPGAGAWKRAVVAALSVLPIEWLL
jgi:putative cardiolipin synthase